MNYTYTPCSNDQNIQSIYLLLSELKTTQGRESTLSADITLKYKDMI